MPRLEDLRPQHVQALLDGKRDDGQANRSVQYLRTVLRSAMEQTRRWQMIRDNPVTLVRAPSVDRKTIRFLSTAEAQQLLAALEGDRLRSLFALAIGTGLRQGEALGLRWDSIDFDAGGDPYRSNAATPRPGLGATPAKDQAQHPDDRRSAGDPRGPRSPPPAPARGTARRRPGLVRRVRPGIHAAGRIAAPRNDGDEAAAGRAPRTRDRWRPLPRPSAHLGEPNARARGPAL